jgi:osmotically-inducible protein OsmY
MNKNTTPSRLKYWIGLCFLCGSAMLALEGCIPTAIVGGGVVGTMAATDRRSFGTQTEDRMIGFKSESVADAVVGSQGHVSVTSFNRLALITGEVPDEGMKARVASEVKQVPNVRNIVNLLEIMPPSSMSSRSNDSLITAKVTTSFLEADGLYANSLKTVTERGTVYLMGRVTEREGDLAAKVASSVPGVQRVIKVFEHISEEELQKMKETDASAAGASSTSTNPYKTSDEYQ